MSLKQYLRIVWARKWIVLLVFLLVTAAGVAATLLTPKQYTASSSLIVEVRIDPALGALAPALAQPSYLATQVEVLKSERVAARVVKMLGVERSASAVQQWREDTKAKIPLDRYFANLLQKGLGVEPSNGSNVLNIYFSSPDPIFAQAAANAFAQAIVQLSEDQQRALIARAQKPLRERLKTFSSPESRRTSEYFVLKSRLQDLAVLAATATSYYQVVLPASAPAGPYAPRPKSAAVVGLLGGLVGGIALALVLEKFGTRLRGRRDVSHSSGTLGSSVTP
jgi:uncharacterized protein involved in exopolysaccharide biosynthesis